MCCGVGGSFGLYFLQLLIASVVSMQVCVRVCLGGRQENGLWTSICTTRDSCDGADCSVGQVSALIGMCKVNKRHMVERRVS